MDVALDSVAVSRLLRCPRARRKTAGTALDEHIRVRRLRIRVDPSWGITDQWEVTCGREYVQQLIIKWAESGGILPVKRLGKVPHQTGNTLRQLGLTDTIDKLLVSVALAIEGRALVSDDSDLWGPKCANPRATVGNQNAPVAKLLRRELAVTVLSLRMLNHALVCVRGDV